MSAKSGLKKGTKERKKGVLTPKKERFCQEYLIDFNNTQAAIRCGYSRKTAYSIGWELLRKPEIQARINELRAKTANEFSITKESLMAELMAIKNAKLEDITDPETGAILPPAKWPEHMKGVISSLESDELFEGRGEDRAVVGFTKKVKLWEKTKAIEILNKMLGFNAPDKVAAVTPEGEAVTPIIKIYTVLPKNED